MKAIWDQISARFWSKVDRRGPDECWPWTSNADRYGRGMFKLYGTNKCAARVGWLLLFGSLAVGECVLHKCDNPNCMNPQHWFSGTQLDNIADRHAKGRTSRASRNQRAGHYAAKITTIGVRMIQTLAVQHTHEVLAEAFDVSRQTISRVAKPSRRGHVGSCSA